MTCMILKPILPHFIWFVNLLEMYFLEMTILHLFLNYPTLLVVIYVPVANN